MEITPAGHTLFAVLVSLALLPFGLLMDALLPRHRAILVTVLAGFMFLPSIQIEFLGFLHWNRSTAPALTVMAGMLLRDHSRIASLRFRSADLPVILFCLAPGFSAISNGFTPYDALSAVVDHSLLFGGYYLIARIHLDSRNKLVDFARLNTAAALFYVPLCLYEFRMSPHLHATLYGFNQHLFLQSIRSFYYRPMVFMQHGLMLAMWLSMSVLLATGLCKFHPRGRLLGLHCMWLPWVIGAALLLTQSMGAILLLLLALICFYLEYRLRTGTLIMVLAFIPVVWVTLRTTQLVDADDVAKISSVASPERAESLDYRLRNEDSVTSHIAARKIFGWSSWGRNQTVDIQYDSQVLVLDSLWIIILSAMGWYGLLSLLGMYMVPILLTFRAAPPRIWREDPYAMIAGYCALLVSIVMLDNLVNAMINPVFLMLHGALVSCYYRWGAGGDHALQQPETAKVRDASRPRVLGD